MHKVKLFCFPYAGGSAAIFNKWRSYIGPAIELCPVELAGRGKRIGEPLYKSRAEAVADIFQIISKEISGSPFAFFGHSLGCMLAYELAQKIRHNRMQPPLHIFFSGREAPHVKRPDEKIYHLMGDEEFKKSILELGGTPREFFDYPELQMLLLPLLKNDFKLAETEPLATDTNPLESDITVLLGQEDLFTPEEGEEWRRHTAGTCTIYHFSGGHFFLNSETERIVAMINRTLLPHHKASRKQIS